MQLMGLRLIFDLHWCEIRQEKLSKGNIHRFGVLVLFFLFSFSYAHFVLDIGIDLDKDGKIWTEMG